MFPLQLLTRLLKSNLPEDLRAANQLIKSLVKEVRGGVFQWVLQNQPWTGVRVCVYACVYLLWRLGTQTLGEGRAARP